jgi:hypothetical protein
MTQPKVMGEDRLTVRWIRPLKGNVKNQSLSEAAQLDRYPELQSHH